MEISLISSILNNLLNPDKSIRESSESQLKQLKSESPSKLLISFIILLKEKESENIKALISLLLRQYIPKL